MRDRIVSYKGRFLEDVKNEELVEGLIGSIERKKIWRVGDYELIRRAFKDEVLRRLNTSKEVDKGETWY